MMTKENGANRDQVEIISLDEHVSAEHNVRKIEAAIDWGFIAIFHFASYKEMQEQKTLTKKENSQ